MSNVTSLGPPAADGGADVPSEVAGFTHHREATARVSASAREVFERLDDQTRLAEHMGRPSAMMGGGRMTYEFDVLRGQAVGSHIRMGGEAFGFRLFVDEVVTVRDPPRRKVWRTTGEPRLIIIGAYEMGFEIVDEGTSSRLRVWIDYARSDRGWSRRVPALADLYARWCVGRMVSDAVQHFASAGAQAA